MARAETASTEKLAQARLRLLEEFPAIQGLVFSFCGLVCRVYGFSSALTIPENHSEPSHTIAQTLKPLNPKP